MPDASAATRADAADDPAAVTRELDAAHARAQRAFAGRDLQAYMDLFHPALVYTRSNGRLLDRERVGRWVRAQMTRFRTLRVDFDRESLTLDGAAAVEVVTLHAAFERRVLLLHRAWSISRRGRYTWIRSAEGWRIRRVEVLAVKRRPVRTWLALG